jgi:hypothetical protein
MESTMAKPIDVLGFGPKRTLTLSPDGSGVLTVTPPAMFGGGCSQVALTASQVRKYEKWLSEGGSIQNAFPELSADAREIILSGIGSEEWKKLESEEDAQSD